MKEFQQVRIRPATSADQSAICALVIRNHLELSKMHPGEYVRQAMDVPNDFGHLTHPVKYAKSLFFVAEQHDGTIVASAGTLPTNIKKNEDDHPIYKEMELTGVSVSPNHRRKGLARNLVSLALQESKSKGCELVHLITLKERHFAAWKLYEFLGFVLTDEEVAHSDEPVMTVRYYTLNLNNANI